MSYQGPTPTDQRRFELSESPAELEEPKPKEPHSTVGEWCSASYDHPVEAISHLIKNLCSMFHSGRIFAYGAFLFCTHLKRIKRVESIIHNLEIERRTKQDPQQQ